MISDAKLNQLNMTPEAVLLTSPTDSLVLIHPPPKDDDAAVHAMYTNPVVLKYLQFFSPSAPLEWFVARREKRAKDPRFIDFRIHRTEQSEATFLGTCGIQFIDRVNLSAEIGIVISHREGVATQALYLFLNHAFSKETDGGLGLHRVAFGTGVDNVAMRGWFENVLGVKAESIKREAWKDYGEEKWSDVAVYALLEQYWVDSARDRLLQKISKNSK
jgi:RimJ/RimL family protein N-acetyltransferase